MKQDIIVFTHNDLDALGCLLSINEKFQDEHFDKDIYHTNYQDIPEKIDAITKRCELKKPDLVIICDVSFSTSEDQLQLFYKYCDMENIKILYMDHHLYPEGFFEQFPKMKLVYDKARCASQITFDTLLPNCENSNLTKLIKLIDVYDIWQDQHPWFDFSQMVNTYFWHQSNNGLSISEMAQNYRNIGFNIPQDFIEINNNIEADTVATLERLETSGLIHRNDQAKVSLFFSNDCFSRFMIDEHKRGQSFVINITPFGLIKVRVNQHNNVSLEALEKIRLDCTGTSDIGHAHAFTWKSNLNFNNFADESLITEAKRVTDIIAKHM